MWCKIPNMRETSSWLFLVYFIYGLSFFSMGLVMLLESWRVDPAMPQRNIIRPMAVFGLLHGLHEWFEIFILQVEIFEKATPAYLTWIRLGLLAASFISLWFYSLAAFRFARDHITPFTVFGLITLPIFALLSSADVFWAWSIGNIPFYRLAGSLVRYGLGVTGAAIATLGMRSAAQKARADQRQPLDRYLNFAAFGFALYSITQLFVPAMNSYLAAWLNADLFFAWTGIPIQVIRTLTAILITLGLFNATRFLESERQQILATVQKEKLEALEQKEILRRDLLRHTVRAQEDERTRIARELHDEMAQILTAFSLNLATLHSLGGKKSTMLPVINRLQDLGRQMSQGMNRMVQDLRPAMLDDLGLVPALQYMVENDLRRVGMKTVFDVHGTPYRLDPLTETVLFRITQESLTNITRHAGASIARLELAFSPGNVEITISDDGIGFVPDEKFLPPRGWGLAGMRERAESVGGLLNIASAPGKGTTITIQIVNLNSATPAARES